MVASLENGTSAFAFSSEMAAVSLLMELLKPGDHIIADSNLYGESIRLFRNVSEKNCIKFSNIDCYRENIENFITPDTKALYIETPTNPMMICTALVLFQMQTLCFNFSLHCSFPPDTLQFPASIFRR